MTKFKLCRLENCDEVNLISPVVESVLPPVADSYRLYASDAMSRSVVPVSTIPAVEGRISEDELPYVMLWLIPQ